MFDLKTIVWIIIAVIFFILAFYGYFAFKPIERSIRNMHNAFANGGASIEVNDIPLHVPPILLCKSIKIVSNISMMGALISSFAAVLTVIT